MDAFRMDQQRVAEDPVFDVAADVGPVLLRIVQPVAPGLLRQKRRQHCVAGQRRPDPVIGKRHAEHITVGAMPHIHVTVTILPDLDCEIE